MSGLSVEHRDFLRQPIDQFPFSPKVHRLLKHDGVETLEDLVKITPQQLFRTPNLGRVSVREVQEVLHSIGLRLAGDSYAGPASATKATPLYPPEGAALTRIADALERIADAIGKAERCER